MPSTVIEPDVPTFSNNINIICLESEAFYVLVEEVVARVSKQQVGQEDKWIRDEEVMRMLGISSKSTLQKLRDEGKIRYSQPSRKLILYDRESVLEYIEAHAKNTF